MPLILIKTYKYLSSLKFKSPHHNTWPKLTLILLWPNKEKLNEEKERNGRIRMRREEVAALLTPLFLSLSPSLKLSLSLMVDGTPKGTQNPQFLGLKNPPNSPFEDSNSSSLSLTRAPLSLSASLSLSLSI